MSRREGPTVGRLLTVAVVLCLVASGCDVWRSPAERGVRYLKVGDYERAVTAFSAAAAAAGDQGDARAEAVALANRCYANDAWGRHEEAVQDCTRSLAIAPEDPEVLNNRGVAHLNLRQLDEAERDFDAAIELRPDYAAAFANRGRVHIDREDYSLALEDLDRAIELDDQLAQAYANRAFVEDNLGQIEDALADFARSLAISRDPQVLFSRAMLYYRFARFDEAYADFKVVTELEPDSYLGYMARTQTEFLENRPTGSPPRRTPDDAGGSPVASAEADIGDAVTPSAAPSETPPLP